MQGRPGGLGAGEGHQGLDQGPELGARTLDKGHLRTNRMSCLRSRLSSVIKEICDQTEIIALLCIVVNTGV